FSGNRCSTIEDSISVRILVAEKCSTAACIDHNQKVTIANHCYPWNDGDGTKHWPSRHTMLPDVVTRGRNDFTQTTLATGAINGCITTSYIEVGTVPCAWRDAAVPTRRACATSGYLLFPHGTAINV